MRSLRPSQASRPRSPDPTSFADQSASDSNDDETREEVSGGAGRKRSSSFAGFFTKLMPSHRPERGGTLRDRGFWEQQKSGKTTSEGRPGTIKRPILRQRHDSDRIVSSEWNTPIPLPKRTQTVQEHREKHQAPSRAQSQACQSRPKSSTPRREVQGSDLIAIDNKKHIEADLVTTTVTQLPTTDHTAPTQTTLRNLVSSFDSKLEARRLRRSLKESRDFLGVQGINPHTGVMDVLTPTSPTSSSHSNHTMMSAPELKGYSETMAGFRTAYERASRARDAEEASLAQMRKEQERFDRLERRKESMRTFQRRVRWRKDRNQWSSVAEPDLSPITDVSANVSAKSASPRSSSDGRTPPVQDPANVALADRAVSTPSDLPTTEAQTRRDTQQSSDTVIHTPINPSTQRRFSLVTDILGDGLKHTASKHAIRRASEPATRADCSGSSSSDPAIRRKPVPSPRQGAEPPELRIIIPERETQSTVTGPSPYPSSFLGSRTEPSTAGNYQVSSPTSATSSAQNKMDQTGNNPSGCSPDMYRSPFEVSPDTHVRDFADEKARRATFANHRRSLERPTTIPPLLQTVKRTETATSTSSQPKQKTLRLHRAPLIPRRLGSNQRETALVRRESNDYSNNHGKARKPVDDLIDTGSPPSLDPVVKPRGRNQDSPASGWAKRLIQDIDLLGQDPPTLDLNLPPSTGNSPIEETETMEGEYAYTPTTTTTGCDPTPTAAARALFVRHAFDGPLEDGIWFRKNQEVTPRSTPEMLEMMDPPSPKTRQASVHHTSALQKQTMKPVDLLSSPPRLPPSVWPSVTSPARHPRPNGPDGGTTSAHQLTHTQERCERLCRRVSRRQQGKGKMTVEDKDVPDGPVPARHSLHPASHTYTSTSRHSRSSLSTSGTDGTSSSSSSSESQEKKRQAAREAARTAVVGTQYAPAAARLVSVPPPRRATSTPGARDSDQGSGGESGMLEGRSMSDPSSSVTRSRADGGSRDGGDIGGLSGRRRVDIGDPYGRKRVVVKPGISKRMVDGVVALICGWWMLVRPVFDAGSPISRRFAERKSTWADCVVYALALGLVLVVFLVVVWGVRGVIAMIGLGKSAVRGCMVLFGL